VEIDGTANDFAQINEADGWQSISIAADIENLTAQLRPAVLSDTSLRLQLKGNSINITHVSGLLGHSKIRDVSFRVEPTFQIGDSVPTLYASINLDLALEDLLKMLRTRFLGMEDVWAGMEWSGDAEINLDMTLPFAENTLPEFNGQVDIIDAYMDFGYGTSPFRHISGPIIMNGKRISAPQTKVIMGPSNDETNDLNVGIEMPDYSQRVIDLTIQTDNFNMDYVLDEEGKEDFTSEIPQLSSIPILPKKIVISGHHEQPEQKPYGKLRLNAHINIGKGSIQDIGFTDLELEASIHRPNIYLHSARVVLANGSYKDSSGKSWLSIYEFPDSKKLAYHIYPNLNNISIADIIEQYGSKNKTSGFVNVRGELYGTAIGKADFMDDFNGSLHVKVRDLKMSSNKLINEIAKVTSMSVGTKGFTAQNIQGPVHIKKGTINIDNVAMKSFLADAITTGSVDVPNNQIDLKISVYPVNLVTAPVGAIGRKTVQVLTLGKAKPERTFGYFIKVVGPLDEPKITKHPLSIGMKSGKNKNIETEQPGGD